MARTNYCRLEPARSIVSSEAISSVGIPNFKPLRIVCVWPHSTRNGPLSIIDGMTADQRFYIGYAQSWLGKEREAATIAHIKSDPHSPAKYRVNGVVVHMPSFYDAFSVAPDAKMYLPPTERVTLW